MGRRMTLILPDYYWLNLPEISQAIHVQQKAGYWQWSVKREHALEAIGSKPGTQAAANAAQRYLVDRAQLTIKLAVRKAA